jgi:hypothetical protein
VGDAEVMEKETMNKEKSEDYNIELDKNIRDSGVQGGKIIGEKLSLGSFIIGIPLFTIGIFSLFYMLFISGFPKDMPIILVLFSPQLLATVIGLLLIIGGYAIYRAKQIKN